MVVPVVDPVTGVNTSALLVISEEAVTVGTARVTVDPTHVRLRRYVPTIHIVQRKFPQSLECH